MEGIIKIEDFRIHCVMGAYAHEQENEQELLLDIEMKVNIDKCVHTDAVADTVNYATVCAVCKQLAQTRHYHLLETFAYEMLETLLSSFPIAWAKVRVKKPSALPLAKYAIVEIEKEV